MKEIRLRARAKINLGLDVIRRLENGYHEVKMIMQTVNIYDELLMQRTKTPGISIKANLPNIPTDERNLIYKAANLMMSTYAVEGGIQVHLKKVIPVAAGMAGGSTDAAAVFIGMNELFSLGQTQEELKKLGVQIGADVPYCIMGGTALSEGIGEVLTELPSPPPCHLVVAKPNIYVSTKYVYENLHINELEEHPNIDAMVDAIKAQNLAKMASYMGNVLESVTIKEHSIIEELKDKMKEAGALNALMSGSGPTVFGIFETEEAADAAYMSIQRAKMAKQLFKTTLV